MRTLFHGLTIAAILLASGAANAETSVTDATGREVDIADASRIAAVGGAVTEILYALGLEDRIIAVDDTSLYPSRALAEKPSVGYMRALSAEGVLATSPSLIIAVEGSGPAEVLDVLENASVPLVLVPEAHDAAGVVAKIRLIAEATGVPEKGEELATAVAADLDELAALRATIGAPRKAVFVMSMSGGSPMVAGRGTLPDTVFALAGVQNPLTDFSGYKPANAEAVMAAAPDAVVLMAERGHAGSAGEIFSDPAFAGSPAAAANRLILMPGSYVLALGPRTAHAARDLAAAVYPELDLPALPERPWTKDGAE